MTAKQWLIITGVVILNIIILGSLLGGTAGNQPSPPTPMWTAHPTFTPRPFATATAILMPTLSVPPTTAYAVHTVGQDETLDTIAQAYGLSSFILRMVNRIPETEGVQEGQRLIIPDID
jgi:hypothetical protein